jgi:hypothetical protein
MFAKTLDNPNIRHASSSKAEVTHFIVVIYSRSSAYTDS